jgi:hypothetical protein
MSATIKSVFAGLTAPIAIDVNFIKRIRDYAQAFTNRSEDHIEFFGGNLIGVHPIRFRPTDREHWFDDVLQIDDLQLQDELHALPTIDIKRIVASDVMNHSCIWAMYAIANSPHLSPAQKLQGTIDAVLVLQYKFLSSIMAHHFKYPADPTIARATYDALSLKFSLKVCGSWGALLLQRAHDIVGHDSIHYNTYHTLNDDGAVIYMINDIQGRLREITKSITAVFYRVKESDSRSLTTRSTTEIDGIVIVKDVNRNVSNYIRYAHEVVDDKQSFIKDELVKIVSDAMHTMPPRLLVESLSWMSVNHRTSAGKEIDRLLDETLIYAYNLVANNRNMQGSRSNLVNMLVKLRSLYMASRMSDPTLIQTRDLSEMVVRQAVNSRNSTVVASLRTGLQLYIVLRTFTKSYYSA